MAHGVSGERTPVLIYSSADVAELLDVSRAAVTQWRQRGADIPTPDFVATDGRPFWLSIDPWIDWWEQRERDRAERTERAARALERKAQRLRERLQNDG